MLFRALVAMADRVDGSSASKQPLDTTKAMGRLLRFMLRRGNSSVTSAQIYPRSSAFRGLWSMMTLDMDRVPWVMLLISWAFGPVLMDFRSNYGCLGGRYTNVDRGYFVDRGAVLLG